MIFTAIRKNDDSLSHYGVKGQKWGIHNYDTKLRYREITGVEDEETLKNDQTRDAVGMIKKAMRINKFQHPEKDVLEFPDKSNIIRDIVQLVKYPLSDEVRKGHRKTLRHSMESGAGPSTHEDDILAHHGVKGQKWGDLNPETKFKYGLTDISPAAAAAAGGYVDGDYKEFLKKKLASGDLNAAEVNSLKMQRIIDNSNMKGSSSSGSLKPVSDEKLAEARSQLSSGKISIDEYRRITKGEDVSTSNSSESESGTAGRNFLQEALSRARQNKEEEEEKKKTKSSKSGSGGKGGSGSKGKGGGGGGKGGKGSKEKEYEPDIDEGPMDYTKSNYFKQLNASKKGKRLRMQRSVTNRSGSTHVQKHGRSLKKRLYHSAMIAKLKGEFLDE